MHDLISSLLHDALYAMGTLLATALVGLVASWAKKNGVELTAAQHDLLMKVAEDGIAYAEEKIANGTGGDKLEHAIGFVTDRTGVSREEARTAIHAALPGSGQGATHDADPIPGLERAIAK